MLPRSFHFDFKIPLKALQPPQFLCHRSFPDQIEVPMLPLHVHTVNYLSPLVLCPSIDAGVASADGSIVIGPNYFERTIAERSHGPPISRLRRVRKQRMSATSQDAAYKKVPSQLPLPRPDRVHGEAAVRILPAKKEVLKDGSVATNDLYLVIAFRCLVKTLRATGNRCL